MIAVKRKEAIVREDARGKNREETKLEQEKENKGKEQVGVAKGGK